MGMGNRFHLYHSQRIVYLPHNHQAGNLQIPGLFYALTLYCHRFGS